MVELVPTVVWLLSSKLIVTLDERFGEPVDTYVNGSQVWLREDGPKGEVIEWRLHPVPGFERPRGVTTEMLFENCALALASGAPPPAPIETLWEGLEAFIAYDDELEPAELLDATVSALGIPADAWGLADHEGIAVRWANSQRRTSIVGELLEQLRSAPSG